MTDEGSAPPPASEPTPVPEVAAVESAPTPEPVISSEAVKEISAEITEAVQDAITPDIPAPETKPESPEAIPAASSSSSTPSTPPSVQQQKTSARGHMLTVVRARKAERLEKIIAMAREKKVIMNDDVQKMLTVSNATATRYLNDLVKAGRLKRFGARKHEKYEAI